MNQDLKKRPIEVAFCAVLLVALTVGIHLRYSRLFPTSDLSHDESNNAFHAEFISIPDQIKTQFTFAPGYALAWKSFVSVFGNDNFKHYLFPFLISLLGIVLFAVLLLSHFSIKDTWFAIFLLLVCPSLVAYSVIAKQYMFDVLFAILILGLNVHRPKFSNKIQMGTYILIGSIAPWISYPSLFLLLPTMILLLWQFRRQTRPERIRCLCVLGIWTLSFFALFLLVAQHKVSHPANQASWVGHFFPLNRWKFGIRTWTPQHLTLFLTHSAGLPWARVFYLLSFLGLIRLCLKRTDLVFLFTASFATVLGVSMVKAYPFYGRCLFFLLPMTFFVVGQGVGTLLDLTKRQPYPAAILAIALSVFTLKHSLAHLHSYRAEQVKGVLETFDIFLENKQEGQKIYANRAIQSPLRYYFSRNYQTKYPEQITQLSGQPRIEKTSQYLHFGRLNIAVPEGDLRLVQQTIEDGDWIFHWNRGDLENVLNELDKVGEVVVVHSTPPMTLLQFRKYQTHRERKASASAMQKKLGNAAHLLSLKK